MKSEFEDKKKLGLLVSYFLSRCDAKAVSALGYSNFTEAFRQLGDLLNENPNNIKNMRDEFDPYFPNSRRGWYQRPLRASRQEIFDEFAQYSDVQLTNYVLGIINTLRKSYKNMDYEDYLKDLGALIRQSTIHYNQDFVWQDVELTKEFKEAYEEYLDGNNWKIEFFNSTSVITTPMSKNIFVPNQWFAIAAYAVGVYSELKKYKFYLERVSDSQKQRLEAYAKLLRDKTIDVNKDAFIASGEKLFFMECHDEEAAHKASKRLWRFATDYSWWSGQKTIDRTDFHLSVVLNMLNLVAASQSYVGDIVNAYGSDDHLKAITKNLDSFTTNLVGPTYDIQIHSEDSAQLYGELREDTPVYGDKKPSHKISISAESLKKIGGK